MPSRSRALHGPNGERLVGFDNAHSVSSSENEGRIRIVMRRPYSKILAAVERVLDDRGVIR